MRNNARVLINAACNSARVLINATRNNARVPPLLPLTLLIFHTSSATPRSFELRYLLCFCIAQPCHYIITNRCTCVCAGEPMQSALLLHTNICTCVCAGEPMESALLLHTNRCTCVCAGEPMQSAILLHTNICTCVCGGEPMQSALLLPLLCHCSQRPSCRPQRRP